MKDNKLRYLASIARPPPAEPRPPLTKADRPKAIKPYNATDAYNKEKHSKFAELKLTGIDDATATILAKPKKTVLIKQVPTTTPTIRPITTKRHMEDFFTPKNVNKSNKLKNTAAKELSKQHQTRAPPTDMQIHSSITPINQQKPPTLQQCPAGQFTDNHITAPGHVSHITNQIQSNINSTDNRTNTITRPDTTTQHPPPVDKRHLDETTTHPNDQQDTHHDPPSGPQQPDDADDRAKRARLGRYQS